MKRLTKPILIFLLTASFLFYEMGLQVAPVVYVQQLIRDLHLNAFSLGVLSGIYFSSYTLMQVPAGLLFDRYPVRPVIVIPVLLCAAGTFLFSISTSLYVGMLARVIMGCASAFAFVAVLTVAAEVFPSKYFGMLVGMAQLLAALGAICGILLPLESDMHQLLWRNVMQIFSLIGIGLAVLIWMFVHYKKPSPSQHKSKKSRETQSIQQGLKVILKSRQTWIIALYACLNWAPIAGFASLWGIQYLKTSFNLNETSSALICCVMWLGVGIASPVIGYISDAIKNRRMLLILCALAGFVAFSLLLGVKHLTILELCILVFIAGAACAGQALSFALVRENNSEETKAAAIGFNNMAVVIAGLIFQPVIGKIIEWSAHKDHLHETIQYGVHNYKQGLWIISACYFFSILISWKMIVEKKSQASSLQ
ncbi:MAG: hypothetical protein COB50_00335 [Thiotrichales bacterium]|nr:MAG: hypothetical protein COB50_00335 [Thiotrichales bacterium]